MSALEINLATKTTMSALYNSGCQQHSCAKVSCSFFEGLQEREPSNLCVGILWKTWLEAEERTKSVKLPQPRLPGLAYHLTMPTLSVLISTGLLFSAAVSDQQQNLQLQTHWHYSGNVNKNCHYRHEKEHSQF